MAATQKMPNESFKTRKDAKTQRRKEQDTADTNIYDRCLGGTYGITSATTGAKHVIRIFQVAKD